MEILKTGPAHCITLPHIRGDWAAPILAFFSICGLQMFYPSRESKSQFPNVLFSSSSAPSSVQSLCLLYLNPTRLPQDTTPPFLTVGIGELYGSPVSLSETHSLATCLPLVTLQFHTPTLCFIANPYLYPASLQTPTGPSQPLWYTPPFTWCFKDGFCSVFPGSFYLIESCFSGLRMPWGGAILSGPWSLSLGSLSHQGSLLGLPIAVADGL